MSTVRFRVEFPKPARRRPMKGRNGPHVAPTGEPGREAAPAREGAARANVGRLARMLALAYRVEQAVEAGEVADYADAARRLGICRSRMAQVVALLNLAPGVQEAIVAGKVAATVRDLRAMAATPAWEAQARAMAAQ